MSDELKLATLLKEFGVSFEQENHIIVCSEGDARVAGYTMFYTKFIFDENGKFIEMGTYE